MRTLLILALASPSFAASMAWSQAPVEPPRAADLREEVQHLSVATKDLHGKAASGQIPVTIYRPAGNGPFPLVIMNHGRPTKDKREELVRPRYENLSRYLVAKGFVVMIPMRLGYGDTYGKFDPENSGGCSNIQPEPVAMAASDQVLQTLEFARSLPYVNAQSWVVMGQSVGGMAAVATVWRNPPGLVAGINFAGGTGGDPVNREADPCRPQAIESLWKNKAASAKVPMLWFYWANDKYWGPDNPKRWHKAWTAGGGKAEFHAMAASGSDGHGGMAGDMDDWVPIAEDFLARAGFDKPGIVAIPRPGTFARLDDASKVPVPKFSQGSSYAKFLDGKKPRAYAIGPRGVNGWATGDWAAGRALGFCQARSGAVCKLYAVDDDVVWVP
jgi:dienelactone hydrolase